ncbi:exopolysaccharide biosynthesis polyprenyl glycosylphosphotransferase [Alcaligenes endophyticus]|uniref:Exopolysaccharide biosynthesis polyprenyl glycosylphosphotransferase n=1 Tax=Alcaligenes endophyticus TaxID=1929088 RepID=A0ABT8EG32_9BURK|nr:exopolysaccharide biosynthesis polyprenyl glycosylphosphotransferase [Alcaligenes endophyticus]MCX5590185.1 exopolysaccharide biosynthesis polyprenyl glycosylphosphotransferase [Alcaligenes endophyticus]MDN4120152.1 exopolysaccharide biosynthesis polyprenyl glycosylphosphotransferase [Alcaligenes endophyticus]
MKISPFKRLKRLHERILLSFWFLLALGWLVSVALPYLVFWSWHDLLHPNPGQQIALWATSAANIISYVAAVYLRGLHPGGRSAGLLMTQTVFVYSLTALVVFMTQLPVSRYLLLASGMCAVLWQYIEYALTYKYQRIKLAIITEGQYTDALMQLDLIDARRLPELALGDVRYDAVVANFDEIDEHQQRFLTQCALQRIPAYHDKQIYESLSGKVQIHRMSENNMGALLPSPMYERLKLIFDVALVIASFPITIPIALLTALLVRLESPGPVIYTQTRIGQGNKPFTIYKFRSMRFDRQAPEQFACEEDPRITKVGRIIRKLRIDELPQFLNILKGEMSLIGPRPEQPSFVKEYDQKIPFYSYRHIVKPGISGWAQVRHGYTATADETQIKIEHDFYYIKNCSLGLDLLIVLLTIRVMLTGFGAR